MKNQVFREYDIRGIVGTQLKLDQVYDLARAIITYYKKQDPNLNTIVIAKDGRSHSPQMHTAVIQAALDMGINVIDIGLCPTPAFYFSLFNLEVTTGMIITASHNPKEYNGIKICQNKHSVWGKQIQEIKNIYQNKNFYNPTVNKKGSIKTYDILTDYIDWLANHFDHLKNININAVIDCGNATAGTVIPKLVKKMNWKNVKILYPEVNGNFPNHPADPTTIKNMLDVKQELKNNDTLELGIGFDGDCDRMNPMTKSGYLVPGDQLLAIYSQQVLKKHPNAHIVFDIKASSSLVELLTEWKANPHFCPSGHSLIKEAIIKHDAKLAGELSCHFFFKDKYFGYDDGIYAALRLFEIIQETGKSLDELINIFPKKFSSPEFRINYEESKKDQIIGNVKNIFAAKKNSDLITIDGIRAEVEYGWGLIRASNTQPVICLRFESNSQEGFKQIKTDFYKALKPYFDNKKLKDEIEI